VVGRLHLFFDFFTLLICLNAMLLTHDDALAPTREIDNRNLLGGDLILLALAIRSNAGVELSAF
jgi:hypothetical protein